MKIKKKKKIELIIDSELLNEANEKILNCEWQVATRDLFYSVSLKVWHDLELYNLVIIFHNVF